MHKLIILALFSFLILFKSFISHAEDDLSQNRVVANSVVAISNLIGDVFYETDDKFIEDQNLPKGNTKLINAVEAKTLEAAIESAGCTLVKRNPGGSAANTIAGMNGLGLSVGLLGTLGEDATAIDYKSSLDEKGITYRLTEAVDKARGSGSCSVFITKTETRTHATYPVLAYFFPHYNDSKLQTTVERTMATSLGVSGEIQVSEQDITWASSAKFLLVEGYLFSPEMTHASICKIAERTKANGNHVALTLSAEFCIDRNATQIKNFITKYTDIIVGNNKEVQKLTGTDNPYTAACTLREMMMEASTNEAKGAVTCGPEGAYVFDETEIYFIASPTVDEVVDTTGAGDQFAAGFLYELLQTKDIIRAGQLGAYCAGEVIQGLGGHPHRLLKNEADRAAAYSIHYERRA
ncbi:MAG: adenosine kinase [Pseudomonadota bacterium]